MSVSRGGGVLLAISNEYRVVPLDLQVFRSIIPKVDITGCKLYIKHFVLLVFVLYIPPNLDFNAYQTLFECFESVLIDDSNLLIVGDFNLPNFVSHTHEPDMGENKVQLLHNFMNLFNLIHNINSRILDLVLSTFHCKISQETVPLVEIDPYHPALSISLLLDSDKPDTFPLNLSHKKYNFHKADFPRLYELILSTDWSILNNCTCANTACSLFYELLYPLLDRCVPLSIFHKRTFPVWYTSDIIKNIKLKHKIHTRFKKTKLPTYRDQFNEIRALTKQQIATAYRNHCVKAESNIISDPSQFWSFIQSKKASSDIPGVLSSGNQQFTTPNDIVNAFANFFMSVYNTPSNIASMSAEESTNSPHIVVNQLTRENVLNSLKKLKPKLTQGPDNIPSFIIKDCAEAFAAPLCIIFNLSLKTNTFPNNWKLARIRPILKKGDPSLVDNYRAICLLSNFAKAFEMCLYEEIFAQVKSIISPLQHGFFSSRSTVTNLTSFTEFATTNLDAHQQIDTVYTDFSKAFDRLDHAILLNKLLIIGFDKKLLYFLLSYLSNREQFVEYRGHQSFRFTATSGAPQGSNLAPLLFSLFINDICKQINSNMLLFADDLKIYKTIQSLADCLDLQEDLNRVDNWCLENRLPLNIEKCKVMTFSLKHNKILHNYTIQSISIERCTVFKDLGVTIDSKLTFNIHIQTVTKSALKMLGFILRTCRYFTNIASLKTLYYCYVRSKLEYGSIVWSPFYNEYISKLEQIQRKFLKFLALKLDGVFPQQGTEQSALLSRFDIPSLEFRRKYSSLRFLFKLCNNQIDCT